MRKKPVALLLSLTLALTATVLIPATVRPYAAGSAPAMSNVGLVDPSKGQWHLRGSNSDVTSSYFRHTFQGVADSQFTSTIAGSGWLPSSGDFGLDPPTSTTGAPLQTDIGFDPATGTIKLGVLASTTGVDATAGASALAGHQAFWDRINASGGVAGQYPVDLVVLDNASNTAQHLALYKEIREFVLAISSTFQDYATAAIYADAASRDLLVVAGSKSVRWALESNVVLNLATGTYFTEFANGAYWATTIASPAVIYPSIVVGIIYEDSTYGRECKAGYDFADQVLTFNHAYEATYIVGQSDFSSEVGGAQAAGVDVLFICATPSQLASMVGTMAAIPYSPTVFGSSPSYSPALNAALGGGDPVAGAAIFNSFPYYSLGTTAAWEEAVPGMVQMRADFAASGEPLATVTSDYFFGYTQAMTLNTILEQGIANNDITRRGVLDAVPMVTNIDLGFGGAPAGYGTTAQARIPTLQDSVALVTTTDVARFGLTRVGGFFSAPFLTSVYLFTDGFED